MASASRQGLGQKVRACVCVVSASEDLPPHRRLETKGSFRTSFATPVPKVFFFYLAGLSIHLGRRAQANGVLFDWTLQREGSQQQHMPKAIGNSGKVQDGGGVGAGVGLVESSAPSVVAPL